MLVPIAGQLEVFGNGNASLTLSATPDPITNEIPIEGLDLPENPFELPTLGDKAAVEINSLISELSTGSVRNRRTSLRHLNSILLFLMLLQRLLHTPPVIPKEALQRRCNIQLV